MGPWGVVLEWHLCTIRKPNVDSFRSGERNFLLIAYIILVLFLEASGYRTGWEITDFCHRHALRTQKKVPLYQTNVSNGLLNRTFHVGPIFFACQIFFDTLRPTNCQRITFAVFASANRFPAAKWFGDRQCLEVKCM